MSCLSSCLGRVRAGLGLWCISVPSWLGWECLLGVRLCGCALRFSRAVARWRFGCRENSGRGTVSRCGVAGIGAGARREGRDAGRRVLLAARDVPRPRILRRPDPSPCPGSDSRNAAARNRVLAPIPATSGLPPRAPSHEPRDAPARHRAPARQTATPPAMPRARPLQILRREDLLRDEQRVLEDHVQVRELSLLEAGLQ